MLQQLVFLATAVFSFSFGSVVILSPSPCQIIAGDRLVVSIVVTDHPPQPVKLYLGMKQYEIALQTMSFVVPDLAQNGYVLKITDNSENDMAAPVPFMMHGHEKIPTQEEKINAFIQAGKSYEDFKDFAAASAAYNCSCQLAPHFVDAWLKLGHVLMMRQLYSEARHVYAYTHWHAHQNGIVRMYKAISEYMDNKDKNIPNNSEMLVQGFVSAMEAGTKTVDAHHTIWEECGVDHNKETEDSLHIAYLWLLAEMQYLQHSYPQVPVQPPIIDYASSFGYTDSEQQKTIVIFCRQYLDELQEPWGPSTIAKGGGGAGEAVIFLSKSLAKLGYLVEVYGNPPHEDIGDDESVEGSGSVSWFPFWTFNPNSQVDIFVIWWHHLDVVPLAATVSKSVYVWLHYSQSPDRYIPSLVGKISGIFAMSQYHAKQLPAHAQDKVIVSSNGIDPSFFVDGPNNGKKLVYASHPFYGLETLLVNWPEIHSRLPDVTLDVYYGFTPGILRYIEANGERGKQYKQRMDHLLNQTGITYIGMVGQKELSQALADSGFYIYPCEVNEISSISLMRAQALGCIPITSRYLDSALPETSQYDLGPTPRPGLISHNPEWLSEWINAIVDAASDASAERIEKHRKEMKHWARQQFPWDNVAKQWDAVFNQRKKT